MLKSSDVTVVIPTIPGREDLLRRAVKSISDQQAHPGNVIAQLDLDRHGAHWARNEALKLVETPWVAWLDDDDILLPNHLRVLVRGANRAPDADLVFTYPEFVGGRDPLAVWIDGQVVPEPINVPWDYRCELSMRKHGNFIPVTHMVKTDLVRSVGGFPEPNSMPEVHNGSQDCEDALLLIKLLDVGAKFHHVCGVRTWVYNFHSENTGGKGVSVQ